MTFTHRRSMKPILIQSQWFCWLVNIQPVKQHLSRGYYRLWFLVNLGHTSNLQDWLQVNLEASSKVYKLNLLQVCVPRFRVKLRKKSLESIESSRSVNLEVRLSKHKEVNFTPRKYLLESEFPGMRIGPEPTTDCFIIISQVKSILPRKCHKICYSGWQRRSDWQNYRGCCAWKCTGCRSLKTVQSTLELWKRFLVQVSVLWNICTLIMWRTF